ncbi:nuclear transport factor 2 family protein [Streptomyces sp. NPDC005485]|uniref:nuclear transport factor 2 family protein n=1 Tax=Streptomyces sp. NPDC005485 TaxID=3155591 RepID=UPI0033A7A9F3
MPQSTDESGVDREEILEVQQVFLDAMVEGDTETLGQLLDDDFTLTHMTGYVQPKAEWLSEMRAGQFVYHSIDTKTSTLDISGDTAHLVLRTLTDAGIYGGRANWRLDLASDYRREGDTWAVLRTVASTW